MMIMGCLLIICPMNGESLLRPLWSTSVFDDHIDKLQAEVE